MREGSPGSVWVVFQALVNYTKTDIKSLHISTGHSRDVWAQDNHTKILIVKISRPERIWVLFIMGNSGHIVTWSFLRPDSVPEGVSERIVIYKTVRALLQNHQSLWCGHLQSPVKDSRQHPGLPLTRQAPLDLVQRAEQLCNSPGLLQSFSLILDSTQN